MNQRKAFTLVELLVVIAIIGILVALLLPAVQSAREAARRMSCANKIKQIGLAVHTFHDSARHFPTSIGLWGEGDRPAPTANRTGQGWIIPVLPYLEQQPLYDQFQPVFDSPPVPLQHNSLREPMRHQLEGLQCPSDESVTDGGLRLEQWQWKDIEVALTSYKGIIGDARVGGDRSIHSGSEPDCHNRGDCNGLFWRTTYQNPISFKDVTDGTSSTYMLGEDVVRFNYHSTAFYANGDWSSCGPPLNYRPEPPTPDEWWNVMGFRSEHPGGAMFCYADGSVSFVTDEIDYFLYRNTSTRAGDEIGAEPPPAPDIGPGPR